MEPQANKPARSSVADFFLRPEVGLGLLVNLTASAIVFGIAKASELQLPVGGWALAAVALMLGTVFGLVIENRLSRRRFERSTSEVLERHRENLERAESECRAVAADAAQLRDELREAKRASQHHEGEHLRMTIYVRHLQLAEAAIGLRGFSSVVTIPELLREARSVIRSAAKVDVYLSTWVEREVHSEERTIKQLLTSHEFAPDHSATELDSFRVPSDSAQLVLRRRAAETSGQPVGDRLVSIDDLTSDELHGADIAAFRRHGYRCLRCFEIDIGGPNPGTVRLIALAKEPRAFAWPEDTYLILLGSLGQVISAFRYSSQ